MATFALILANHLEPTLGCAFPCGKSIKFSMNVSFESPFFNYLAATRHFSRVRKIVKIGNKIFMSL